MAEGTSAVAIAVLLSKIAVLPPPPPCRRELIVTNAIDVRANDWKWKESQWCASFSSAR
jgi:hypothetical protein